MYSYTAIAQAVKAFIYNLPPNCATLACSYSYMSLSGTITGLDMGMEYGH